MSLIVFDAMTHFHGERVECGDLVIMPNHVHALLTPLGRYELEDILHSVKSFSAHAINAALKEKGVVWMKESHDHIVRDAEELLRIQAYIRSNPERAGVPEGQFRLRAVEYQLDV
ncbi:Transposase IS200 like protein [Mariniblastus fucicola]|uniref:Transposase IS200 like protein n=2 Tax=Mariniblastus fucicola TaxID=980251 RepID=A0A5B9PF11_9BACT|nr:Transposase IS200 like protein [Mariniblastus fucicola]